MASVSTSSEEIRSFFAWSQWLDHWVLRPLSHITLNWETRWDHDLHRYHPEPNSFAADLNVTIDLIATCSPPARYHDPEDRLAYEVIRSLRWPIQKKEARWIGADYEAILAQGGFADLGQHDLVSAASGRVHAAILYGQRHVDDMEERHRTILTALMTIIIYHRYCDRTALFWETAESPLDA